jgi:hypothetical protein
LISIYKGKEYLPAHEVLREAYFPLADIRDVARSLVDQLNTGSVEIWGSHLPAVWSLSKAGKLAITF